MRKTIVLSVAAILSLVASVPLVLAQGTYTQIDYPGASDTACIGVNNLGDLVGYYEDADGIHGFLLSAGVFTALDVPYLNSSTIAVGINDVGQIVGTDFSNGFLYDIQTREFTKLQYPHIPYSIAYSINNAGTIVGGIGRRQSFFDVGFELNGTTYTTMKAPGAAYTILTSINNIGEAIVEGYPYSGGSQTYFLLDDGEIARLDNAAEISPWSINDLNVIVGSYAVGHGQSAGFVKQGSTRQSLKFPGGGTTYGYGINNAGVVVGYFYDATGYHGFTWTPPADAAKK